MSGYNKFDPEIYSEEIQPVTEQEHDEVMMLIAEEGEAMQGYASFSSELESENFIVRNGRVYHKPEPVSLGRIGGYEL
jgi:hypothetical protein